jgi:hypothetical protein
MFQYVCDSCSAVKQPEETWILGIAAEAVAPTAARREVNILSRWDPVTAADPLAVHFCSLECRDDYMARVFGTTAPKGEVVVETMEPAEVVIERTVPTAEKVVTKKVVTSAKVSKPRRKG